MSGASFEPYNHAQSDLLRDLPVVPARRSADGPGALVRGHVIMCGDTAGNGCLTDANTSEERGTLDRIVAEVRSTMGLYAHGRGRGPVRMLIHQECIVRDTEGSPRGANLLVEMRDASGWIVYTRSGLCHYHDGPAMTHVRTSFATDAGLWMFPLLSYAAFGEDLNRISTSGTQIALGLRGISHVLDEVTGGVRKVEGGKFFEPSGIRRLLVRDLCESSAQIILETIQFGTHHAMVSLVPERWCVATSVERDARKGDEQSRTHFANNTAI